MAVSTTLLWISWGRGKRACSQSTAARAHNENMSTIYVC